MTDNDHVVLFDNGVHCLGSRKTLPPETRVVEYDISTGTQAPFVREYRRPADMANGITWGAHAGRDRTRGGARSGRSCKVDDGPQVPERAM